LTSKKEFSFDTCDALGISWISSSDKNRLEKVSQLISRNGLEDFVEATRALSTGYVYVRLLQSMSPGERGTFLLDLEEKFKTELDVGLSVWCDPLGDRNSLRNLRGVQISKGDQGED